MFHVRVFEKKEEEGLFIFYFLFFKMAAILFDFCPGAHVFAGLRWLRVVHDQKIVFLRNIA